jgi:hypothetical protein
MPKTVKDPNDPIDAAEAVKRLDGAMKRMRDTRPDNYGQIAQRQRQKNRTRRARIHSQRTDGRGRPSVR